jgi:FtsZ-interacting cell division protein ZipA
METLKETVMNNIAVSVGLMIAVILVLIYYFWYNKKEKASGKKGASSDEAELDELIEKIHSKQKKKPAPAPKK